MNDTALGETNGEGVAPTWTPEPAQLFEAGCGMDEDEAAGLRAFALNVGAYAGSSNPERPLWIEVGDRRIDVASLDAQWREDERLGFRVKLSDGSSWLLYYVPELDLWSGTAGAVLDPCG